jgi:ATP-dependent Clp protease protease subunit
MPVAKKKEPTLSHYDDVAYTLAADRRVNLYGQVGDEQLSHIDNMLSYLIAKDKKRPISMQMNTPGGSVSSGLAIYDAIMRKRAQGTPIDILVQGVSMSMGVIILQAARERLATPHSQFLLHEVSYGSRGHMSAQEDELEVARKLQEQLDKIILDRSGISPQKLKEMTKRRDTNISAQEALELNLIDGII